MDQEEKACCPVPGKAADERWPLYTPTDSVQQGAFDMTVLVYLIGADGRFQASLGAAEEVVALVKKAQKGISGSRQSKL